MKSNNMKTTYNYSGKNGDNIIQYNSKKKSITHCVNNDIVRLHKFHTSTPVKNHEITLVAALETRGIKYSLLTSPN